MDGRAELRAFERAVTAMAFELEASGYAPSSLSITVPSDVYDRLSAQVVMETHPCPSCRCKRELRIASLTGEITILCGK